MQPRERLSVTLFEIGVSELPKGTSDKDFCTSAVSLFCDKAVIDAQIKEFFVVDDEDYAMVGVFTLVVADIFSRPFSLDFEKVARDAVAAIIDFDDAKVMASGYAEAVEIFSHEGSQKYLITLGSRVMRLIETLEQDHYNDLVELLEIGREHLSQQA